MDSLPATACPHLGAASDDPSLLPLPPGEFGLPVVGETLHFGRDPRRFVAERRARYGDIFKTHLLGSPTVFLMDEGGNHWIFRGEGDYLENHWNPTTRRLLGGNCTAILTGEEHACRRRQLMPQFRHSAMVAFAPTFERIARDHYGRWAEAGGVVTLIPANQKLVFQLIVALLLGDETAADVDALSRHFRRWTAGLSAVPVNLPLTTYGRALRANRRLRSMIADIVSHRQALSVQPPDLLGAILGTRDEKGQPMTHDQVVDEVHNQLFAGHDTTVTVMTNLMIALSRQPDTLARARAEADGLSGLDLDELAQLPYLNAVLDESMRATTPVIGTFRIMRRDAAYGGYRIPAGWTVRLEIAGTHEDPALWDDPLVFDPERWLGERGRQARRPHSYLPFGGGPRVCLGASFAQAEMRVMLALLLREYAWELAPGQNLDLRPIPFPRPKSGGRVVFYRRRG